MIEALNLRTRFEETTKDFNMPDGSCIDTIEWFIENGHRSNSLRNGFEEAMAIAKTIKEYADGCRKEASTWEPV
jgi:hypothetical protein